MTPKHPTIADFEALVASDPTSLSTIHQHIGTDPANFTAFYTWFQAKRCAEREVAARVPPVVHRVQPRSDFDNFTTAVDFSTDTYDQIQAMENLLDPKLYAHVGLGVFCSRRYRLRPRHSALAPMFPGLYNEPSDVAPQELLGVNWNVNHDVEPADRNLERRCNDETGFAFMQFGRVEWEFENVYQNAPRNGKERRDLGWYDSGYVLVVEIGDDGKAGAVWMLWDFYPENYMDCGVRGELGLDYTQWAMLQGCKERITAFKLADCWADLEGKEGEEWFQGWDGVEGPSLKQREFQIVNLEIGGEPRRVVRQTVA
jgi:hypothetical protein